MFNNAAIDICLGIVFVILLYSLLATIVQEILARWLGIRPRMLLKAVERMLRDSSKSSPYTLVNFFIDSWKTIARYFVPREKGTITKAFFDYPQIKYLAENNWSSKPSYISAGNFSQTLIRLLSGQVNANSLNPMVTIQNNLLNGTFQGFNIDPETRQYIIRLVNDSNNDLQKFTESLESWYNDTMLRCTGWYKRQAQLMLFIIGLAIAVGFNVDLIAISKIMANDEKARAEIVNMAISRQKSYGDIVDTLQRRAATRAANDTTGRDTVHIYVALKDSTLDNTSRAVNQDILKVQSILGLGRNDSCKPNAALIVQINKDKDSLCKAGALDQKAIKMLNARYSAVSKCQSVSPYQNENYKFIGWLLTALAISLGAPFWFDLLNKIMQLRGTGKRPPEQTDDNTQRKAPPVKPVG